ncbi:MAG: ribonuclease HI family protein, partial [Candidatus Omnitrophica bacterium]|nr:ribonuclease HI family protein [Candidatus Omnitrophota bacterium]
YIGRASNNVAEYTAMNLALSEALTFKAAAITIKTDSELVARQLSGQYKVKSDNLKPLYVQAMYLIDALDNVKIVHIKRHLNKEADRLATLAVDKHTS